MRFETPLLLLGLLGAAVPVVIHLINRQRARHRLFAALEHILISDKRLAQRLKIRQLLVLALRVLLIAALALALAKPYLPSSPGGTPDLAAPGSVVVIVDDSLSMQSEHPEGGSSLERGILAAREAMDSGGSQTRFAVVAAGNPARLLSPGLSYDREVTSRALDQIRPAARAVDMGGAIREAERLLAEVPDEGRRVLVISDQASHAWGPVTEPWALVDPPRVDLIPIVALNADGEARPNLAITAVHTGAAVDQGPDHLRVEVDVRNHGPLPARARVQVRLDGPPVVASVEVEPESSATAVTLHRFQGDPATVRGEASLLDDDVLEADNTHHFTLSESGAIRVLVVNGAPRSVGHLDETYFLRAALDSDGDDGVSFRHRVVGVDELTGGLLEAMDVVILANVGGLSPSQSLAVEQFVRGGGGVLITSGDQLTPEASLTLGPLLPLPIRDIKEVSDPGSNAADLSALRLTSLDTEHPALAPFGLVDDVSLLKARTFTHALVDTAPGESSQVIAAFTGGRPALVEGSLERGRTLLFTTSIDRDWSDLVVRTSFVPLVHQLIRHLAGALEQDRRASWRPGDRVTVNLPGGVGPLVLERPDGGVIVLEPGERRAGEAMTLDEIDLPGHYTLRRQGSRDEEVVFAVNGSSAESEPGLANLERLGELLVTAGKGKIPARVAQPSAPPPEDPHRTRLWPWVLLALFGLLLSEGWLVLRG